MGHGEKVLIHIIRSPRRIRENEAEIVFEDVMAKKFPNLKNDTNIQIHEILAQIQE